jgi:hypothetical protein
MNDKNAGYVAISMAIIPHRGCVAPFVHRILTPVSPAFISFQSTVAPSAPCGGRGQGMGRYRSPTPSLTHAVIEVRDQQSRLRAVTNPIFAC